MNAKMHGDARPLQDGRGGLHTRGIPPHHARLPITNDYLLQASSNPEDPFEEGRVLGWSVEVQRHQLLRVLLIHSPPVLANQSYRAVPAIFPVKQE